MNVLQCFFIALFGSVAVSAVFALAVHKGQLSDSIARVLCSVQIASTFTGAAIALFIFLLLQNIF